MPDPSTELSFESEVFKEVDFGAPMFVDWFCIFQGGKPLAVWDQRHNYWVHFESMERMPQFDHLDPYKVQTGEQKITAGGESGGT